MVDKVHHVEMLCKDVERTLKTFLDKFGFKLYCRLKSDTCRKSYVLKQGSMLLVLNEGGQDTVYNIAFEVNTDVCGLLKRFDKNDILEETRTISDKDGVVVRALIKTPVGNVVHSLLNLSDYHGDFLPGYVKCVEKYKNIPNNYPWMTHYDHITYACFEGTSHAIISWYEKHFSFSRFFINDSEDIDNGYVVRSADDDHLSSFGMRLTAMEFWRCAEIGVQCGKKTDVKVKLVLAEALPGQGPNQVRNFLSEHGGAGVQHIGLHTNHIVSSVTLLKEQKVEFITPPSVYYSKGFGKQEEAKSVDVCFEELAKLGILLDSELDNSNNHVSDVKNINKLYSTNKKHLMQIFTKPLFDKETFFLEIIQRCGATGFGAGNIRALWRAIDAHLKIV